MLLHEHKGPKDAPHDLWGLERTAYTGKLGTKLCQVVIRQKDTVLAV